MMNRILQTNFRLSASAFISALILVACSGGVDGDIDTGDVPDSLADLPGADGVDFAEVVTGDMIDQALAQLAAKNPSAAGIGPFIDNSGNLNVDGLKAMNWSNNDIRQAYLAFGIELLPLIEIALENLGHIVDAIGSSGGDAEVVEASSDGDSDGEIVEANASTEEIVLAETSAELPEHAQFVDENGDFDRAQAARSIYESENCSPEEAYDRAREMEREWQQAYSAKTREVVTRV